jgi:hypothetical protein
MVVFAGIVASEGVRAMLNRSRFWEFLPVQTDTICFAKFSRCDMQELARTCYMFVTCLLHKKTVLLQKATGYVILPMWFFSFEGFKDCGPQSNRWMTPVASKRTLALFA